MIPTAATIRELWKTNMLPPYKQNHCMLVARLAVWFGKQLSKQYPDLHVDLPLLEAAALLHDIDKAAPKNPNERHPDAAVRILRENGYTQISDVVRTHSLHAILDQSTAPQTLEQKLLYLSDKMVKHTIITVDERFALWRSEKLPERAIKELDAAYPKVKALEKEICSRIHIEPGKVAEFANAAETSTMMLP